jgi:hypothetical protein
VGPHDGEAEGDFEAEPEQPSTDRRRRVRRGAVDEGERQQQDREQDQPAG